MKDLCILEKLEFIKMNDFMYTFQCLFVQKKKKRKKIFFSHFFKKNFINKVHHLNVQPTSKLRCSTNI
jgi:hypothetical protein